jgi:hypothetical protein
VSCKIEQQSDGSAIVKLGESVTVAGEEVSRLTIPRLKGKHLFGAPAMTSVGMVLQWAANIVSPKGALEELEPRDAVEVGDFLFVLLTRRPTVGAASSASSAATSDGASGSS